MSDGKPVVAQTAPMAVDLQEGETVWWCGCGRSRMQPFCDGSHAGTAFEPMCIVPEKTGRAFLCTCKQTANPPYCDGAHRNLPTE